MYGKVACPVPRGAGDQPGYGRDIVAPPRKQVVTEKTNFFLQSRKAPVYSKDQICLFPSLFAGMKFGKIVSVFMSFQEDFSIKNKKRIFLIEKV